jgi:hypothetical protein
MNYINWDWQNNDVVCTHPYIERVWCTAADMRMHQNDPHNFRSFTHLLMKNGEIKDFMDVKESFDAAEEYLQSLGDQPFN